MHDLWVRSIFARWYDAMFVPPVSLRLSRSWGVSIDEVHVELLSWAVFVICVLAVIVILLFIRTRRKRT